MLDASAIVEASATAGNCDGEGIALREDKIPIQSSPDADKVLNGESASRRVGYPL